MQTASFEVGLEQGFFSAFCHRASGRDYLPAGQRAPVATVRVSGRDWVPSAMEWLQPDRRFALYYGSVGVRLEIGVTQAQSHLRFEVCAASPLDKIELVVWGPYPTSLGRTIGETVGVVQDEEYAIGIQALNAKTLGGFPQGEADVAPTHKVFAASDYADIAPALRGEQLLRGNTALAAEYGSRIQAYCRNRPQPRRIENWGQPCYQAPNWDDGGIIGSKIALFGVEPEGALAVLAAIEVAEGLPHPQLDGQWAKGSPGATASYIIVDFSEANIAEALALTQQAGLRYLYHSSPFATWGHFKLKEESFPNGWDGFRQCVASAAQAGIGLGFHTLSNFITTNDAYVSPVPDRRLARIGTGALSAAIDAEQQSIGVLEPRFFAAQTELNTVRIGAELIEYDRLSQGPPWRLLGCKRGAWQTGATAHAKGAAVARLADHGYKVFLAGSDLTEEVAGRIADFCNYTGAAQLSFDGLEGNHAAGMGDYSSALFTKAWYERLDEGQCGKIINDASQPGHYNWHTYTRMNWGEPWYAGFRQSQTQYRLQNQNYYRRNLMPAMLGWFALRQDTTLEDVEWLLARAAGFDAGFALATSMAFAGDQIGADAAGQGGQAEDIAALLAAIRAWESARMAGVFPASLKEDLQDIEREFHLVALGTGVWRLHPVHSHKERLAASGAVVVFDNPHKAQAAQVILTNAGTAKLEGLAVYLSDVCFHREAEPLGAGAMARAQIDIVPGAHRFSVCWQEEEGQELAVELRTQGEGQVFRG